MEKADANIRTRLGEGLLDRLDNPHRLCSLSVALDEVSQLGEAPDEPEAGANRGEARLAEALVEPLADEGLDILPVVVGRLPIVAQEVVIEAQGEGRRHLQGEVPAGCGNGEGAL